jgi:hypothetical protein
MGEGVVGVDPSMVYCTAAPPVVEDMERITAPFSAGAVENTGTANGAGEELPPPAPPPQDAKKHDMRAAKIEMVSRRVRLVLGHAACLSFNMVDYLFLDSSGPLAPGSSERVGVP